MEAKNNSYRNLIKNNNTLMHEIDKIQKEISILNYHINSQFQYVKMLKKQINDEKIKYNDLYEKMKN